MNEVELHQNVQQLLEEDRAWCAYALADLDPAEVERSTWLAGNRSVVLIYKGLDPPVLFAHGEADELTHLLSQVPPGVYQFTLQDTSREMLGNRLKPQFELNMWRMVFNHTNFPQITNVGVKGLNPDDLPSIQRLFETSPDKPDSFHEHQLETGPFFGIYEGDELLTIAGVHVCSEWASVAAVGNVFTRPDRRGQGLATRASAAVLNVLLEKDIQTIVLNVAKDNMPALHVYQHLGFRPYCGYLEGIGNL